MVFLSSLLIAAASALAAAAVSHPAPSLTGEWVIIDYQGRFFNLVDTDSKSATPVQGWGDDTVSASQVSESLYGTGRQSCILMPMQWLFVNTSTTNVFEIINVGTASSLSYSTLVTGGEAIRSQIVGNQQITTWSFTPPSGQYVQLMFTVRDNRSRSSTG